MKSTVTAREYLYPTSAELDALERRWQMLQAAQAYAAMTDEEVQATAVVLATLEAFGASLRGGAR